MKTVSVNNRETWGEIQL